MCPDVIINQDNYDLTQSQNETLDKTNWDIEIDLCLTKFTGIPFIVGVGEIKGLVTDSLGNRLENATVALMTTKSEGVFQSNTDASGKYLINNVPKGTYFLIARYTGKQDQKTDNFLVAPLSTITRNFVLQNNASGLVGIIIGSVLGAGVALVGIAVAIYFGGQLIATAITGAGGAFAIGGLIAGLVYLVSIFVPGFLPIEFEQVAVDPEDINNDNPEENQHDLEIDYSFGCTISGIITDENTLPINRADVILYSVQIDNSLYPIAFMKTNEEGLYLFKVPMGNYIIKSTQNTTLTID